MTHDEHPEKVRRVKRRTRITIGGTALLAAGLVGFLQSAKSYRMAPEGVTIEDHWGNEKSARDHYMTGKIVSLVVMGVGVTAWIAVGYDVMRERADVPR